MYSLHLICAPENVDTISAELWEAGTVGIREIDLANGSVELIAGFENNSLREQLLNTFAAFRPDWRAEADTDWVREIERSWPGRPIGTTLFLAPPWCDEPTPPGRERITHNPGLACGTGEHPCTRLAMQALECTIYIGCRVADIGAGSGILAIAARRLGASVALALDLDEAALHASRENFALNQLDPLLVAGSAECIAPASIDIVVANISGSVLLAIADELLRIVCPAGALILTGFQEYEEKTLAEVFPPVSTAREEGWSCFISRVS